MQRVIDSSQIQLKAKGAVLKKNVEWNEIK